MLSLSACCARCPTQWDAFSCAMLAQCHSMCSCAKRASTDTSMCRGAPIATLSWYNNQTAFSGASSRALGLTLLTSAMRLYNEVLSGTDIRRLEADQQPLSVTGVDCLRIPVLVLVYVFTTCDLQGKLGLSRAASRASPSIVSKAPWSQITRRKVTWTHVLRRGFQTRVVLRCLA